MSQHQAVSDALVTFGVAAEAETATKTRVEARDFEFFVDEPEELGGEDAAPNPVEYLIGAWAGCLNVVAHQVAGEYGIQLDSLRIAIDGDIDPRKFLGQATDPRAGYQHIQVDIQVETGADAALLEEWFAAVEERCPVGDNISNATPVETSLSVQ